ncbi:MAG TPA: hypothetical protein VIW64_12705 [Pyrinomonadaceae bacterium]|jgi:hypothetical protein
MTQRNTARKMRADGVLGEEEGLWRRSPNGGQYLKGICAAQPEHFDYTWPTSHSEIIAQKVLLAIKRLTRPSMQQLGAETGLKEEQLGTALATLSLWDKSIGTAEEDGVRVYFVKETKR